MNYYTPSQQQLGEKKKKKKGGVGCTLKFTDEGPSFRYATVVYSWLTWFYVVGGVGDQ